MTVLFVFGLAAIMGLMIVMKLVFGSESPLTTAFTALSFLILMALEGVFIGMLLSRDKAQKTKELGEAKARMLPGPVLSVTEHTTRELEAVDRNDQRR